MRKTLAAVLSALVSLLPCVTARAAATASVEFTGPGVFNINMGTRPEFGQPEVVPGEHGFTLEASGASFTLANIAVELPRGGSADFFYDYTITLRDDGLAAARTWSFCVPLSASNCGPTATGNELASVTLYAGYYDSRSFDLYSGIVSGELVSVSTDGGSFADGVTESGRLHVHVQATSNAFAPEFTTTRFSVYALATVDASPLSPVPEPASILLVLAGSAALLLRSRYQPA